MISPHFPDSKFDAPSIDDFIDVFEDRVKFWVLQPAKDILELPNGQIAGFCLTLTYFEGIWTYLDGGHSDRNSGQFFVNGFADVFRGSQLSEALLRRVGGILYADARCGFFHDGMFRERIYFGEFSGPEMLITLPKIKGSLDETGEIQSILIHPGRFLGVVNRHFERYVDALRKPTNVTVRSRFTESFERQCDWKKSGPVIGIPDPFRTAP
jgi:hypothetical protein